MKQRILLLLGLFFTTSALAQQVPDYGQAATIKIWDNATAPHSNELTVPEKQIGPAHVTLTSEAVLYLFPADKAKASGEAIVICPGGGYVNLSIQKEGVEVARWFTEQGISAAVLKYRVPNRHPEVPLEDAEQAIRIMKGLAPGAEGYTCERVGIAGFSAGGHLAATTCTLAETKADFAILFYPVITATPGQGHQGSYNNLLPERTTQLDEAYSLHRWVSEQTPPTLLLLSDDDRAVPPINSILYYNALKERGIKASMHIYPSGGHGWGFNDSFPYKAAWQESVVDWLRRLRQ